MAELAPGAGVVIGIGDRGHMCLTFVTTTPAGLGCSINIDSVPTALAELSLLVAPIVIDGRAASETLGSC